MCLRSLLAVLSAPLVCFLTLSAQAEEGILVEVTYRTLGSGEEETISGEIFFEKWPLIDQQGKSAALAMQALRARKKDQVLFSRLAPEDHAHTFFEIRHRRGTVIGRFPFERIPLNQSSAGMAEASLDRGLDSPRGATVELTLEEEEPLESFPVTMEVSGRPARDFLDVDQILAIRGLVRPGDEWAPPTGRFVQYSRAARGSGGQVVLEAATFFGGEGHENFTGAAFSPSGDAIWAVANLAEVDWTDAPQFYPDGSDAGGDAIRRETGVIVQYSDDLARLTGLLRFPESSLSIERIAASPEGKAVYISGSAGHQFSQLEGIVGAMRAVRPAGQTAGSSGTAGAAYDDGGSFIARLQPDGSGVQWILFYPMVSALEFDFGPDEMLLTHSRRRFWEVSPEGKVLKRPELQTQIRGRYFAPIAVSPLDGSFYLGGEYHSGTGLEPWRNPFLHAFDLEGEPLWTAWNWTGPLVGVRWSRLVSDSAVRQVQVGQDGNLLIRGWSDGGNSVFTHQPYDFRSSHGQSGFAGSVWGASVLSVSYLMRMDVDTLEITAFARWLAYLPSTGKPNSAKIEDVTELENRDVAFSGHTASGMIETHDAWVRPWYLEQQKDQELAKPKGGPYFAVFNADFKELRLSTALPGLREPRLASRGQQVLLSGSAVPRETAYGIDLPPLLRNPVQDHFGGGESDAYLLLIRVGDQ